jgi:uncharacterized protein
MPRSGVSELPLHGGDAPRWLFTRMVKLASAITEIMLDEYGSKEVLRRMADPFWFQAYSCVLGFDWHSSGTTTVTCGAMKVAMQAHPEIGVAGGKGAVSRQAPAEISSFAEMNGLSESREKRLRYCSRMSAKVDSAALQDGHQLYHHVIIFDLQGNWAVVQQGMSNITGYARRYQWCSDGLSYFVEEPHTGLVGKRTENVLDMTSRESNDARAVSIDLVKDGIEHLERHVVVVEKGQSTLSEWMGERPIKLHMPRDINWTALRHAYEFQPKDYEELISLEGIGPSTVRALALISELMHGTKASWNDPVKFSFAVGGKDGVPYPVDRKAMDNSIEILRAGIGESKVSQGAKLEAVRRLQRLVPPDMDHR